MPAGKNNSAERLVIVTLGVGYALIIISREFSGLLHAGFFAVGIGGVLVAVAMAIRITYKLRRAERRESRNECLACGYPLGASIICPECGKSKP